MVQLGFSEKASHYITDKPRLWEYSLMAQCADDEISAIDIALEQGLRVKSHHSSRIKSIKGLSDLVTVFDDIREDITTIRKFGEFFYEISPDKNEQAFGPPGQPGNSLLIQMLAKRCANKYYEIFLYAQRMELELSEFHIFLERNKEYRSETFLIMCHATEAVLNYCIKNSIYLNNILKNYGAWLRIFVDNYLSNKEEESVILKIDCIGLEECLVELEKVTKHVDSQQPFDGMEKKTNANSTNDFKNQSQIDTNTKSGKSLNDVIIYICEKNKISKSNLRDMLLPHNYFPSSFIDRINEVTLDFAGEIAIEEANDFILVNQDVINKIDKNLFFKI